MSTSIGSVYISVVPSLEGFASKLKAGTALSSKQVSAQLSRSLSGSISDPLSRDASRLGSRISPALRRQGSLAAAQFGGALKKGINFTAMGVAAGGALVAGIATAGVSKILSKGLTRAMNLDTAVSKLGSLKYTGEQIAGIRDTVLEVVKGTKFTLDETMGAAGMSLASGIGEGEDLKKYLRTIADAATITGIEFGQLSTIFNKVQSTGRLMRIDMGQLEQGGLPISLWLAKDLNVSQEILRKMVSKGQISAEQFRRVINENVAGAAADSGSTLAGAADNYNAALSRLGERVLTGGFPTFNKVLGETTSYIDTISERVGVLADRFWRDYGPKIVKALDFNKIEQSVKRFFKSFQSAIASLKKVAADPTISFFLDKIRQVFATPESTAGFIKTAIGLFAISKALPLVAGGLKLLSAVNPIPALTGILTRGRAASTAAQAAATVPPVAATAARRAPANLAPPPTLVARAAPAAAAASAVPRPAPLVVAPATMSGFSRFMGILGNVGGVLGRVLSVAARVIPAVAIVASAATVLLGVFGKDEETKSTAMASFKSFLSSMWVQIQGIGKALYQAISPIIELVVNLVGGIISQFTGSTDNMKNVMTGLDIVLKGIVWVATILKWIINVIVVAVNLVVTAILGIANFVMMMVNAIFDVIDGIMSKFGKGFDYRFKQIKNIDLMKNLGQLDWSGPKFATGGTVKPKPGGTLALLAEAGRSESVVDTGLMNQHLRQVNQQLTSSTALGGAQVITLQEQTPTVNITVNGSPGMNPADIAREVKKQFVKSQKRYAS